MTKLPHVLGLLIGVLFGISSTSALAADAVRIGVIHPLTGVFSGLGLGSMRAIRMAFEEEDNMVAGRKIELFEEDTETKAETALTKARKLVERNEVDLLLGGISTAGGYAMRDYVDAQKLPWITTTGGKDLTRSKKSPYIFRFAPSGYQWSYAPTKYLKEVMGWKKVIWIASDYVATREAFEPVQKVYGEDGIVMALWPPFGAPDFAPFLTTIDQNAMDKADAVIAVIFGGDAVRLLRQFREYGYKEKLPFFGYGSITTEENLPGMPPETEGIFASYVYCGSLDTPENKSFVEGFKNRYNSIPGSFPYQAYMSAKMMIQAIKDVNGNVEDKDAFLAALSKVSLQGPMGKVSFDKNGGVVQDFYLLKVVEKDGRLQNECVDKIPQVGDPYQLFP